MPIEPLPKGKEILRFAQNDNCSAQVNDRRTALRNDTPVILSEAEGVAKDLSKAGGVAKDLSKAGGVAKDLSKANGAAKDLSKAEGVAKDLSAAPVAYQGFGRQPWNIVALASFGDVVGYGLHVTYLSGRWGGCFSFRTNFVSQLYAYDVLSDGTTGGETGFEAKGDQRIGELSASAGVVRSVTPWLNLYAGAGYGSSTLCWNDIHGTWAKVKDYSGSGLMLDGGAVLHLGRLSLLGGVSWLTARPEAGPFKPVFSLGAGISFHGHP